MKKSNKNISNKTLGQIKVTRNISATRVESREEPMDFPESGVLYLFKTDDWVNKMSFYDKVAYSFGIPSTQKPVYCTFLNTRVMHYERTCQGVYYCKFHEETNGECTVKPARFRFHACSIHKQSLQKSANKCPVKLHFYVPLDTNDHRRLLLCLNDHNHALLKPATSVKSESPMSISPSSPIPCVIASSSSCDIRTPSPLSSYSAASSPSLLSPVSPVDEHSCEQSQYYCCNQEPIVSQSERSAFSTRGTKRTYESCLHEESQDEKRFRTNSFSMTTSLQFLNMNAIKNNLKPEMLPSSSEYNFTKSIQLPSISTLGLDFIF
jgi:hypothetical protein